MNRWTFISGLTVTLLLLLILSGFCVWITRSLTADVDQMIAGNFDTLRAQRDLLTATARIDAHYRSGAGVDGLDRSRHAFDLERAGVLEALKTTRANAHDDRERALVTRLEALVDDYFANYERYFTLTPGESGRFRALSEVLAQGAVAMAEVAGAIMDTNERAILARRDAALAKGRSVTVIASGFAIFSVSIYVLTSMRLTRAVFEPLRRLRDSIQQVSDRQFDAVIPIEGGGELGQIAEGFNRMAGELHRYVSETDERALHASRVSRAILEALPYPVYIVDSNFSVHLTNPRADALSESLGIPGSLPADVRQRLDEAASAGTDTVNDDVSRAVRLTAGDDEPSNETGAYYLPQIFQMPSAFDGGHGWAVLLVDITRLRRMDAAKTRALSTLGHEVKTPVAGVRMTLQLLLDEKIDTLSPVQRELVEAGRDDCERLLGVLRALLELAQLESGRIVLVLGQHAPEELLSDARAAQLEASRRSGRELRIVSPAGLPRVLADPPHALRVLGNFISNALKYGSPQEPIELRAHSRGDGYVRFSVVNRSERLLSESEQTQVFEPFFRRSGERAEGTGLGLAISREIAVLHGGRVGIYCQPAERTVEFHLDLCSTR